jgi:type 1 glutamine amidotransferase
MHLPFRGTRVCVLFFHPQITMRFKMLSLLGSAGVLVLLSALLPAEDKPAPKPLKALLVIGGCCHEYGTQKDILKAGLEERANVVVDILYTDDKGTRYQFPTYQNKDWAKGYDVIIHDECTADVKDVPFVQHIVDAHKNGVPAVNLHCAMHSYRVGEFKKPVTPGSADALWFDMLGLQSYAHGAQLPIAVTFLDSTNPITKGMANWTTIKEELYNNAMIYDSAKPLAKGKQGDSEFVVVWTNEFGPKKTRIFSTTLGHNTETVMDGRYLDLVARGLLWSCGKLDDGGRPADGYGTVKTAK